MYFACKPLPLGSIVSILVSLAQSQPSELPIEQRNSTCSTLGVQYRNQTLLPSDSKYASERIAHWSQVASKTPSCIFYPKSSDDIVTVVKLLSKTTDKFAVRSGGHSPLADFANVDSGLLISMRDIVDLNYDTTTQHVRSGSGNKWGQIYEYLVPSKRLVVGGRSPTVGFGLLGGGGLSHLSNEYGFASSNVVKFEVVLANGTKTTASETSNQDLFYALRGGGNNYGIITHVTFRTVPMDRVWGGTIVYSGDKRDAVMSAIAEYQTVGQLDQKSALLGYLAINNDTIFLNLAYTDDVARPAAFAPFYNITPLVDGTSSHDNFTSLISGGIQLNVPRWTWGSTVLYLDPAAYLEVARICQNATDKLKEINGATMVLMPQPISESIVTKTAERGDTPLNVRDRKQLWFCINMGWNFAADDDKIGTVLMDTLEQMDAYTKEKNLFDPFVFLNDAYFTQNPFEGYGTNVKQKLKTTAQTYDPKGFFQSRQAGGFKISKL